VCGDNDRNRVVVAGIAIEDDAGLRR